MVVLFSLVLQETSLFEKDFPSTVASAPVTWQYLGQELEGVVFGAGVLGLRAVDLQEEGRWPGVEPTAEWFVAWNKPPPHQEAKE